MTVMARITLCLLLASLTPCCVPTGDAASRRRCGADLDQQFGQTLDSERLKVLEVRVFFEGTT